MNLLPRTSALAACALLAAACSSPTTTSDAASSDGATVFTDTAPDDHAPPPADTAAGNDAAADSAPTDAGAEAGPTDAAPESGSTEAGVDAGPEAAAQDAATDAAANEDGAADAATPGPDAAAESGADASTTFEAGPDAGVDAGIDAGIDADVEAGAEAGAEASADAAVETGADAAADVPTISQLPACGFPGTSGWRSLARVRWVANNVYAQRDNWAGECDYSSGTTLPPYAGTSPCGIGTTGTADTAAGIKLTGANANSAIGGYWLFNRAYSSLRVYMEGGNYSSGSTTVAASLTLDGQSRGSATIAAGTQNLNFYVDFGSTVLASPTQYRTLRLTANGTSAALLRIRTLEICVQ